MLPIEKMKQLLEQHEVSIQQSKQCAEELILEITNACTHPDDSLRYMPLQKGKSILDVTISPGLRMCIDCGLCEEQGYGYKYLKPKQLQDIPRITWEYYLKRRRRVIQVDSTNDLIIVRGW